MQNYTATVRSEYSDPILTEKFTTTLSQPPLLSQPLLQARGSELQLQTENGHCYRKGKVVNRYHKNKTDNFYCKDKVVNCCYKHKTVNWLSQVASSQSRSQAHTSQVLPEVQSSQSLSQVQTSQPMLPQINQLLRMPQPESQHFCQLPRQPLLHTSTATSQVSQSTPVVNYAGIHPYHPVQTHSFSWKLALWFFPTQV